MPEVTPPAPEPANQDQPQPDATAPTPPTDTPAPPAPPDFKGEIKDVEFEGYKFTVDTSKMDDVEVLDMLDQIEHQDRPRVIIDFLVLLLGQAGYDEMKAYYVKKDGRFKLSTLTGIYQNIFADFDPKGLPS